MPQRPLSVILIVVGTLSSVVLLFALTQTVCGITGRQLDPQFSTGFKEFALVALGGLGSLLARVSTGESTTPIQTQVVNTPADPVNVTEKP